MESKYVLEVKILNKLILIDGNSLSFRAFYALPLLQNKAGIHTNAVYGFAMLLEKIIKEEQPTHFLSLLMLGKQHLDMRNIVNIKVDDNPLLQNLVSNFHTLDNYWMHTISNVMN